MKNGVIDEPKASLDVLAEQLSGFRPSNALDVLASLDPLHACVRTLDGTIKFWCHGNEILYGWKAEEALGRTTYQLLQTEFPKALEQINAHLLEFGCWEGELRQQSKWGSDLWVASQWVLQQKDDQLPIVVEVNTDVTQSRNTAEKARFLASIVESSGDAIMSKDLNSVLTSWNIGAERLFGYSAQEILGKSVLTLFPPELVTEELAILARLHRGERIEHYETVRVDKWGKRIEVSLSVSPVVNENGTVTGATKIVRDISQRRSLERAVQESEERQRLATEAGELGLWSYDTATGTSYLSPRCHAMFGFAESDSTPEYAQSLKMVHPEEVELVDCAFRSCIEEGRSFDLDFRIVQKNGSMRWVQSRGRARFRPDGRVAQVHGTMADLTTRKKTEDALRRSNAQLEQFAYAAAHDLQEPLRNISLSISLAQRLHRTSSEEAEDLLNRAVENSRHMEEMVRDLLAYATVLHHDEERWPLEDCQEALAVALNRLDSAIRQSSADISFSKLPAVRMDRLHLQQLFQNLVGNSLKYCGEERPTIEIGSGWEQPYCRVWVKDNGIGIKAEFRERVFGLFKRLRDKDVQGTGIGLALCKRIVQHYGGEIWLEHNSEGGTTVLFTAPYGERTDGGGS